MYEYMYMHARCCSSSHVEDELAMGALWLYRATNDATYLQTAQSLYSSGLPWAYDWDSKHAGVQVRYPK